MKQTLTDFLTEVKKEDANPLLLGELGLRLARKLDESKGEIPDDVLLALPPDLRRIAVLSAASVALRENLSKRVSSILADILTTDA